MQFVGWAALAPNERRRRLLKCAELMESKAEAFMAATSETGAAANWYGFNVHLAVDSRQSFGEQLKAVADTVEELVRLLLESQDGEYPYRAAGNFLRLLGLLLMAYAWTRSARLAGDRDDEFHRQKR